MVYLPVSQEQLTPGLLYLHYEDDVHCFTFSDMDDETVDVAFEKITGLDSRYARNQEHLQYLYILDDVVYTPYMLKRLIEAVTHMPAILIESVAIVTDTFLARTLQNVVLSRLPGLDMQSTQIFNTEAEAFAWLEQRRELLKI